jgi:hypothetical protein
MMIGKFDADGSGELSQTELQSALSALRQHMQNQGGGNAAGGGNQTGGQNRAGQRGNAQGNQGGPASGTPKIAPGLVNAEDKLVDPEVVAAVANLTDRFH